MSELTELHNMKTYYPVHAHKLTRQQRIDALSLLIFLTQKRDKKVKGHTCVNGSKQRGWISKESAALPTAATESVMITAAIEAYELRRVIMLDIPGAFLHAELDEDVVMLLKGELAEMMVLVDPKLYRVRNCCALGWKRLCTAY